MRQCECIREFVRQCACADTYEFNYYRIGVGMCICVDTHMQTHIYTAFGVLDIAGNPSSALSEFPSLNLRWRRVALAAISPSSYVK